MNVSEESCGVRVLVDQEEGPHLRVIETTLWNSERRGGRAGEGGSKGGREGAREEGGRGREGEEGREGE